ncbi:hypothetical protein V495_07996, partial [Pseudogymnoascus sp. VKM F-4514 (FW-929)]
VRYVRGILGITKSKGGGGISPSHHPSSSTG